MHEAPSGPALQTPVELHVWHSPHATQLPPTGPQAATVLPGWQVPTMKHPLQQVPLKHRPTEHIVPSAALTQPAPLQLWHSLHTEHALPLEPHALGDPPALHAPPESRQPLQQLPPAQCPAPPAQTEPSPAAKQAPVTEQPVHSPHVAHARPPWPHALAAVPTWQAPASTHPVQHAPAAHRPLGHASPSAAMPQAPVAGLQAWQLAHVTPTQRAHPASLAQSGSAQSVRPSQSSSLVFVQLVSRVAHVAASFIPTSMVPTSIGPTSTSLSASPAASGWPASGMPESISQLPV